MAKIVPSYDPDILQIRSGGGAISCIGFFFLIPSIAISIAFFSDPNMRNDVAGMIIGIVFSFIFLLVALAFLLGRAGTTIDRRYKTIIKWWGLLLPFRSTELNWNDYKTVTIRKEIRRTKNGSYTVYVGRISGEKDVSLGEHQDYFKTRQIAEAVAIFMKFSLADSSTGVEIVRPPEELNEPLRNRLRRTGNIRKLEDLPSDSKIKQRIENDELVIALPKMGWGCLTIFMVFVGIVITIILISISIVILQDIKEIGKDFAPFIFIAFLIPGLFMFFSAWKKAHLRTEVHVSPQKFYLKHIGKYKSKVEEIPLTELEELQLITSGQQAPSSNISTFFYTAYIIARSDYKMLPFGNGLSTKELNWLIAVLENTIAA